MENEQKQKSELNAVPKKVFVIVGLVLVLLLPLSQVENQISSRREYETVAQKEVAKGWGENVVFSSPILFAAEKSIHPTTTETTIEVDSKEKKRGVFRVPVYIASLKTKVIFSKPISFMSESPKDKKLSESDYLIIAVKPTSSIQNFKIKDVASGKELKAKLVDGGIRLDDHSVCGLGCWHLR